MKNVLLLVIIALAGCNGEGKDGKKEEVKAASFFPVTSYIGGQIHIVDSMQSLTMKYTTNGNKTDTVLISIEDFKHLAQEFIKPDFNDDTISIHYKENSFADQSINGVAFNYSTTDKDLEIQRVDVIVDASAVVSDNVRSIYMEKQSRIQDTFVYKKLYWRADRNFQIITTKQLAGKPGIVNVTKVQWD